MDVNRHKMMTTKTAEMLTVAVLAALIVAGCMTTRQLAPPVEDITTAGMEAEGVGAHSFYETAALTRGRDIYLTQCISCHAPEPIDRYTLDQWREILPDMAHEARLNESQISDLSTYVITARKYFDRRRP